MQKIIVMCLCVMLMASVSNAATIRFHGSGSWDMLEGVGQTEGWQSPIPPGPDDTVRANWGNNTITLNYETTVGKFQAGVDESGTFHIQNGGILSTAGGNNKIGNNNVCTGTMIIDAGGTVNSTGWLMVAGSSDVTGILDASGTLSSASHLWCATGPDSTATIDINSGGVINVGGMIGLGTINATTDGGGIATLNVNDGGLLSLSNIHSGIMNDPDTGNSIRSGSMLNINGTGRVTLPGNFVNVIMNGYAAAGLISGNGVVGFVEATYDADADLTTVKSLGGMDPSPIFITVIVGSVDLSWTNLAPDNPADPVYVDVWFGTDPNKLSLNYTLVVDAGENANSVVVSAPTNGTYYWQVDSYINGPGHINDANMIEGNVWSFEASDDAKPANVNAGVNMMTWPNQSVDLEGTYSDDGTSPVTETWTSSDSSAVFSPSSDGGVTGNDPNATVIFDNAAGAVILTFTVQDGLNPAVSDDIVVTVYADRCQAARIGANRAANYPGDFTGPEGVPDCIVDFIDLAEEIAAKWLVNYELTDPVPVPGQ